MKSSQCRTYHLVDGLLVTGLALIASKAPQTLGCACRSVSDQLTDALLAVWPLRKIIGCDDVRAVLRETKSEAMHEDDRAGTSCSVPAMRDAEDVS